MKMRKENKGGNIYAIKFNIITETNTHAHTLAYTPS